MTGNEPLALYLRLSAAEGEKPESGSIANQRTFLNRWAAENGFCPAAEFVDDGCTGTDFQRPGFKALMETLKQGKIRCFATVDLSRLGRNYLEVGLLLEQTFPLMGVRYIAVNDGYDSSRQLPGGADLAVFKNLINDWYARDASQKVVRAKRTLQHQGKYLGSSPPYGYRLDPADRYRLLPDENTAWVVQRIYSGFLAGQNCAALARELNREKIPPPAAAKGGSGLWSGGGSGLWSGGGIRRVLTHPVYKGDMVQHMREMVSYKVHRARPVPRQDWIQVQNTHEPLVSRHNWEEANRRLEPGVKRQTTGRGPFSGLAFCGDCGAPMYAHPVGGRRYLICSQYSRAPGKHLCTGHHIREDLLLKSIRESLLDFCSRMPGLEKEIRAIFESKTAKGPKTEQRRLEKRQKKLAEARVSAYLDKAEGLLSREEYRNVVCRLDKEEEALRARQAALEGEENKASPQKQAENFLKLENLNGLQLRLLIKQIRVKRQKQVEVEFSFCSAGLEADLPGQGYEGEKKYDIL